MSKYRTWTPEDKAFLEEKWGEKPIGWIAGRLGRTEDAVVVMSRKMGLGPHLDAGDCISMNQLLYTITGSKGSGSVTKRWIENGLPVKRHKVRRCYFRVISIDAFWKWAEALRGALPGEGAGLGEGEAEGRRGSCDPDQEEQ